MGRSPRADRKVRKEASDEYPVWNSTQSLGKWIDNLLGDRRDRRKVAKKAAARRKHFPRIEPR